MANYNSWMRSSYFKVEDREKFEEELETISFEDLEMVENGEGEIALIGSDFSTGHRDVFEGEDFVCVEEVDTYKIIQKYLIEGESVLLQCVGHEKLRYVGSFAVILTKHRMISVDLEDEIKKKAVEEGLLSESEAASLVNAY